MVAGGMSRIAPVVAESRPAALPEAPALPPPTAALVVEDESPPAAPDPAAVPPPPPAAEAAAWRSLQFYQQRAKAAWTLTSPRWQPTRYAKQGLQ